MDRVIYKVNTDGFVLWDEIKAIPASADVPEGYIDTPVPQNPSLHKPRWTGKEWVEGMSEQELSAMVAEQDRQRQINELEKLLKERYEAHSRLLATDADPAEIEEVKGEIALILGELGGLYNATTT